MDATVMSWDEIRRRYPLMIILSKNEKVPLILSLYWSKSLHIESSLLVEIKPMCSIAHSPEFWLYFILVAIGGLLYE